MMFTDIHSHFIYGMDDGARTKSEMEAMLDASYREGVSRMIATPHATPGVIPFDKDMFERHMSEAREYCRKRQYKMELYDGAEVMYTPAFEQYLNDHSIPTLADTNKVLLEFSPTESFSGIAEIVRKLERYGYAVIIAHVERYAALRGRKLYQLKEQTSVKLQMNCSTVLGCGGFLLNARVNRWLKDGLIDYIASDCHGAEIRRTHMQSAYERIVEYCGVEYAVRITDSL